MQVIRQDSVSIPERSVNLALSEMASVFEVRPPEVRVQQVRLSEIRLAEIRLDEVCLFEVCPSEIRLAEIRLDEVCPSEVRVEEVCPSEVRVFEVCPAEMGLAEVRFAKVCPSEDCIVEVRPAEGCLAKVCLAEVRLAEIRPAEVGFREVKMLAFTFVPAISPAKDRQDSLNISGEGCRLRRCLTLLNGFLRFLLFAGRIPTSVGGILPNIGTQHFHDRPVVSFGVVSNALQRVDSA